MLQWFPWKKLLLDGDGSRIRLA